MRHGERDDDFAENLEFAGAEGLRDPDVERRDLGYALVHHDHAREERRVEQDDELGDLINAEIDDHQRDQRDRRQRPEEIDHRIGEYACRPIPAEQEADRNGDKNAEHDAKEYPPCRSIDVEQQAFMQQQFDKFGCHPMRRRNQGSRLTKPLQRTPYQSATTPAHGARPNKKRLATLPSIRIRSGSNCS